MGGLHITENAKMKAVYIEYVLLGFEMIKSTLIREKHIWMNEWTWLHFMISELIIYWFPNFLELFNSLNTWNNQCEIRKALI